MADPKWKILTQAQDDVVLYLSNILGGSLLDSLQAKKLLINTNYEELLKMRETKIDNSVAQELVVMLKRTPPGSYDKFCKVLRKVEGGKDVYDRLKKEEAQYMQEPETDTDGGGVRGLLQEEIQEKHLRAVYLKIQAFWKLVARELGLPEYEIDSCQRSHSLDEERCRAMLQKWKTRQKGKGKVWDLASAIYKAELEGVVEEVYGESVLKALQATNSGTLGDWIAMPKQSVPSSEPKGVLELGFDTLSISKERLIESRSSEEYPASDFLRVRGMTLKFTYAQTVLKCVDQSGGKIESEFFSLSIPPGAVVGSAVNVGFTVYEYQSEESEGVDDDTDITDLLVLHPCGKKFAEDVTIRISFLSCVEHQRAFLFYKGPDSVSFSDTCVGVNLTQVRGGIDMSALLRESYLDITTKHFCMFFACLLGCVGHTYHTLAFGRWGKGETSLKEAAIDIHFTSPKTSHVVKNLKRNESLPLLLEQNARIYFNGTVNLEVKNICAGWQLISDPIMPIDERSLQQAKKRATKYHTQSLTLKKQKEDASNYPWIELRLTGGGKTNVVFTLKEYSSCQTQASPGEVRSASAGEYFDQPLTNSAVRRSSTESRNKQEMLKRKPTPQELNKLSDEIATDWEPIARCLSVPDRTIGQITKDYANKAREQAYQALQQWMQQESESATVEALCRALCGEGKRAIAAKVFKLDDDVLRGLNV